VSASRELRPSRTLWFIDLDHESGMRHGGNLRWFNLSRQLLAAGHEVYFAINTTPAGDLPARVAYLESLERSGHISGHFVVRCEYPQRRVHLARFVSSYPPVLNCLLHAAQRSCAAAVRALVTRMDIDRVVISDRTYLFLSMYLLDRVALVVDWIDSFALYYRRSAAVHLRARRFRAAMSALVNLCAYSLQERYYARRVDANLVVSPVDKACLDRIAGSSARTHVLLNGMLPAPPVTAASKIPNRLVFTGNMNFPPNYEGALWFIDEVLPRIRARQPRITFVVAGRNPIPALLQRRSESVLVLGAVEDLWAEIAKSALFVAPLISGGGFKNKILEAIAAGTFVAAISTAVEALPDTIRRSLLVGDSPDLLSEQILTFLANPGRFESALPGLLGVLSEEFSWRNRAAQFLALSSGRG